MHEMKIPVKIANWIKSFLTNRKFIVDVNSKISKEHSIKTGVPQGSILSPILFLIFINDIPIGVEKYTNESLLFADDLFNFFGNKNLNRLQLIMQKYLLSLEDWLKKWRLKASVNKCSYNIYVKRGNCTKELDLQLFGQKNKKGK